LRQQRIFEGGGEERGATLEREKEEKGDAVVIFAIRYADVAVASDATPSFFERLVIRGDSTGCNQKVVNTPKKGFLPLSLGMLNRMGARGSQLNAGPLEIPSVLDTSMISLCYIPQPLQHSTRR